MEDDEGPGRQNEPGTAPVRRPDRRRWLVAAAALVLVAAGTVAVRERRERRALEARVARLERKAPAHSAPEAEASPTPDGAGEGPLAQLLESLGGGPGGLLEGLGGGGLAGCSSALSGAVGGGLGSLFGPSEPAGRSPDEQLSQMVEAVQELRGLRFTTVPRPVFLAPDQLKARARALAEESLSGEEVARDGRVLAALGALRPGSDLKALVLQALEEQVAGFYDTETGELVVGRPDGDGGLDALARMALAHELDHALTDQALGLPVEDGRPPPGTEDQELARLALVEGDATLAMQLYGLAHVSLSEQFGTLAPALAAQQSLKRLPHQVQASLLFPYLEGLSFTCRLHASGGWKTVDDAYRRAPVSTAQVLFPDRYLADEKPLDPEALAGPGDGWRAAPAQSFGAAQLLWLLEAPGGEADRAIDGAREKVAAWGGGELRAWERGSDLAVGLVLAERPGESGLCRTVTAWYRAAFPRAEAVERQAGEELAVDGASQDASVRCDGGAVRLGIGPELAIARTVVK